MDCKLRVFPYFIDTCNNSTLVPVKHHKKLNPMKNKTLLPYEIGLPTYLDEIGMNQDWQPFMVDGVGSFVVILQELQPAQVFDLAINFSIWREKNVKS